MAGIRGSWLALHSAALTVFSIPTDINPRRNSVRLIGRQRRAAQTSTAMRMWAEIIASDVSLLVTLNHAIDSLLFQLRFECHAMTICG
jgi:hypothetical protein